MCLEEEEEEEEDDDDDKEKEEEKRMAGRLGERHKYDESVQQKKDDIISKGILSPRHSPSRHRHQV